MSKTLSESTSLPGQGVSVGLLNYILPNGLPKTGTVLLLYEPGSGEMDLLTHLLNRYMEAKQSVLYLALDNFPRNIKQLIYGRMENVDWGHLSFVDCYSKAFGVNSDEAYVEDAENLSGISVAVSSIMRERAISVIVLDSLSTLIRRRDLHPAIEFLRILIARTRQSECLCLVLLNGKGFHPTVVASVKELVDGIVELKIDEVSGDMVRSLRVPKMVGTRHLTRWVRYEISEAGELTPSLGHEIGKRVSLPIAPTALIGREIEVAEGRRLLLDRDQRLVTLTGSGGVGKTRLGLEIARGMADNFAEGVCFVPLEQISDPNLLPHAIAKALGLTERKDLTQLSILQAHFRDKETLLFLDNFEQIVTAAPQLAELLVACPKLKVLVTSRQPLNVEAEHELHVRPLPLPDLKRVPAATDLLNYASVELLMQRGRAEKPGFRISDGNARDIAEICVKLDGLPLALELIAPFLKLYSPEMILAQLKNNPFVFKEAQAEDLPDRHRTLRNVMEWSYRLLSEDEKSLFAKLSVFVGGADAASIASICSETEERTVELLTALAHKNLVNREENGRTAKFAMLGTVHAFASLCLARANEEEETKRKHAGYFLNLVEVAKPELQGARQLEWFQRLELEFDNVGAALEWWLKHEAKKALLMVAALWRFWYARGHLSEGMKCLSRTLALSSGLTAMRAEALYGAGAISYTQGRYSQARAYYQESLDIFRTLGNEAGVAAVLNNFGTFANDEGNYSEARRLYEESLEISRKLGDDQEISYLVNNLALLAQETGDYRLASSMFEESLAIKRRLKDERAIAATILNLGNVARDLSNYEEARANYEESLVAFKRLGEIRGIAYCVMNLALVAIGQGDYHRAKTLLSESLPLIEQLGDQLGLAVYLQARADLAHAQHDYHLASILYKDSLRLRSEIGDKVGSLECVEGLAAVASLEGHVEHSIRLYSAAQNHRKTVGVPLPPAEEGDYVAALANARHQTTEKEYAIAWEAGRVMNLSELIELSLEWRPKKPY